MTALVRRRIQPPIAATTTGREAVHQRGRRLSRTVGYRLSQRARKKIEELWGEATCWHGVRRFQRRGLLQVRDEAYLMGGLLNLKRLAKVLPAPASGSTRGLGRCGGAGEHRKWTAHTPLQTDQSPHRDLSGYRRASETVSNG
jgi:hypothetical protein